MDVNRISGYIPGKIVFFLMQVCVRVCMWGGGRRAGWGGEGGVCVCVLGAGCIACAWV